jgi:uncharacterized YigZ family protein
MTQKNNTINAPAFFELIIKKSRFIAYVEPCNNKQHAKEIIERLEKQYPDARHICYSFITQFDTSMNDDGEPSGTAGKPIYNVLQHKGLMGVIAVVVRYFGGIKLGAGGLTRAYGNAVSQALDLTEIITPINKTSFTLAMPFELENKVRHLNMHFEADISEIHYSSQIDMRVEVIDENKSDWQAALQEQSSGKITIKKLEVS